MSFNFVSRDRDQPLLMPLDMRYWLSADHLMGFVVDVIDQIDLSAFWTTYRADGHGRAAHDPRPLVAVLLNAYCTGCARGQGRFAVATADAVEAYLATEPGAESLRGWPAIREVRASRRRGAASSRW